MGDNVIGHIHWRACQSCAYERTGCQWEPEVDGESETVVCWGFEPKEEKSDGEVS